MAHIPDEFIIGRVEDIMESYGEFNDAEAWSQMTTCSRYCLNNIVTDILGQLFKFREGEISNIGW
jgi:hypothetical protein